MKSTATTLYPFVPSGKQFAASLEFFAELGFKTEWKHDGLAGLRFGGAYFMLQDINVPVWQENQMITYEVTDLEAYWNEIAAKELEKNFAGVKLKAPKDYPWGREIHIIDLGGVCWHVRQTKQKD